MEPLVVKRRNIYWGVCTTSDAGTGGASAGGPLAPPIFGRSVKPIQTREGRLSPPITTGTPNVFHLPASLYVYY